MKKGQGLSVNVIIVAVLALLVLVVIAFIFTGKIGQFSKAAGDCTAVANSICEDYICPDGYAQDNTRGCFDVENRDTGQLCCVPVM